MIWARATIETIQKTRNSVEKLGGQFKSNYSFKDVIFVLKTGEYNLNNDFVRLRVYTKSSWQTKNVVLTRKKTEWKEHGKEERVILTKEFDTETEAAEFIKKSLPEFKKGFEYSREGWQYELNRHRVHIEDIKGYVPSVEIEAGSEAELQNIFQKIGAKIILKESIPNIMKDIFR